MLALMVLKMKSSFEALWNAEASRGEDFQFRRFLDE